MPRAREENSRARGIEFAMTTRDQLLQILDDLPPNFFGSVEIGFQNSQPGTVKIIQSYRLDKASRPISRGLNDDRNNR
jgi:hypothetical protein